MWSCESGLARPFARSVLTAHPRLALIFASSCVNALTLRVEDPSRSHSRNYITRARVFGPRVASPTRMSEPLRVLIVNGVANFDHIRSFTHEMQYELERLGCKAAVLDVARPCPPEHIEQVLGAHRPDFVFSFNASGCGFQRKQAQTIESASCPWLTFMLDDPMYHDAWGEFLRRPHVVPLFGDPQSLISAERLGIPAHKSHLVYAGAHMSPKVEDDERCHEVLFIGTIDDPIKIRQSWTHLPSGVARIAEMVSETWSKNIHESASDHLERVFQQFGLTFSDEERWHVEAMILGNVIRYVKSVQRLHILRSLKHLPISIFGCDDRELFRGSNFRFFPTVSYSQAQEEICRAKIVLNAQTLAIHAAGERSLGALLNGALLVASESRYLEHELDAGVDYFPFSLENESLQSASDTIEYYLQHPAERRILTARVRDKAEKRFTWALRAKQILEIAHAAKAARATESAA
jgi:hypothetical protein